MTVHLATPVAAYFLATNRHDVDAMLHPFAAAAVVHDERADHVGHAAIRAWMVASIAKYAVTVEPQEAVETLGHVAVVGLVSGNFPGSPARLRYGFTLSPDGISRLEIH